MLVLSKSFVVYDVTCYVVNSDTKDYKYQAIYYHNGAWHKTKNYGNRIEEVIANTIAHPKFWG